MTFSSETNHNQAGLLISTAYLPPVSYVAACLHEGDIRIEMHETYPKQTICNHCLIFGPNGKQVLSIPVTKTEGNHTKTRDVRLSDTMSWQKMHWRSIQTAYSNSPFFLYYSDYFAPFFEKKFEFLVDFNTSLLETLFHILKMEKTISGTASFEKVVTGMKDLRFTFGKKNSLPGFAFPEYTQVFSGKHGFLPDLSILDLVFNLGPEARSFLKNC